MIVLPVSDDMSQALREFFLTFMYMGVLPVSVYCVRVFMLYVVCEYELLLMFIQTRGVAFPWRQSPR